MHVETYTRNSAALMLSAFAFLFLLTGCGEEAGAPVDPVPEEAPVEDVQMEDTEAMADEAAEEVAPVVEEVTGPVTTEVDIADETASEESATEEAPDEALNETVNTEAVSEETGTESAQEEASTEAQEAVAEDMQEVGTEPVENPTQALLDFQPPVIATSLVDMVVNQDDNADAAVENYIVDLANSVVRWQGRKVIGGSHEGSISLASGEATVQDGNIVGGSFTIDMNSIVNLDDNGSSSDMLVKHLKADDFFNTAQYPTATFNVNQVNGTTVEGSLYLHGVTNDITLPYAVSEETDGLRVRGQAMLDRTQWGIEHKATIQDEITIAFDVLLTPGQ